MSKKTIILDKGAEEIIRRLERAGFEAYAVGGSVRDALLGRPACDWDITTSALPEEMEKVFEKTFESGIEHGTITVRLKGQSYEVTTYRLDGEYQDHRHPVGVSFTASLREDLARRDFTINAFAYHPDQGLVDCFDGMKDLQNGLIRCVGEPNKRFDEDALRILRALRFAATLDFTIEEKTFEALVEKAPFLADVSRERVETELNKLLLSQHPDKIETVFITPVVHYIATHFEEIYRREIAQNNDFSSFCALLKKVDSDRVLRWSMLLRSLTSQEARELLRDLRFDNQSRMEIEMQLEIWNIEPPKTPYEMRVLLNRVGQKAFLQYYALHAALNRADEALLKLFESQKSMPVSLKNLAVSGKDLLEAGVEGGVHMGETLSHLMDLVLTDPQKNKKEILTFEALHFVGRDKD